MNLKITPFIISLLFIFVNAGAFRRKPDEKELQAVEDIGEILTEIEISLEKEDAIVINSRNGDGNNADDAKIENEYILIERVKVFKNGLKETKEWRSEEDITSMKDLAKQTIPCGILEPCEESSYLTKSPVLVDESPIASPVAEPGLVTYPVSKVYELPLYIPIERCYDVQWNPPGYPELRVHGLDLPYGDRLNKARDGYYTFSITDGEYSFVHHVGRTSWNVFDKVDFLVISEDILLFNGNFHNSNNSVLGGGYGTLIKGKNIAADDTGGSWATQAIADSDITPEEWLLMNFGLD